MDRRSLLQGAVATTAVAGTALLGAQAAAADVTVPVPQGTAPARAYPRVALSNGKMTQLIVQDRTVTYRTTGGNLSYQPLKMWQMAGLGGDTQDGGSFGQGSYLTVTPSGQLGTVFSETRTSRSGVETGTWTAQSAYGSGWQNSEDVAFGYDRLYRLLADGRLTRYSTDSAGRFAFSATIFTGGGRIKRIAWAGQVTDASLGSCDALLATLTTGELREYRIQRTGTRWRSLTLKPAGSKWDGLVRVQVSVLAGARTIVGQWADNRVSLYYQLPNGPVQGYFTGITLPSGARLLG